MFASDSIDLLTNCGIQFARHETEGIDPIQFSELLITSGLVLSDNVKWISFHRYIYQRDNYRVEKQHIYLCYSLLRLFQWLRFWISI